MSDITGTIEFHAPNITEDGIDTLLSELMTHLDLYGNEGGVKAALTSRQTRYFLIYSV